MICLDHQPNLNLSSSGLLWMPSRKEVFYKQPGMGLLSGNTRFVEFPHCLVLSNWYYLVKSTSDCYIIKHFRLLYYKALQTVFLGTWEYINLSVIKLICIAATNSSNSSTDCWSKEETFLALPISPTVTSCYKYHRYCTTLFDIYLLSNN